MMKFFDDILEKFHPPAQINLKNLVGGTKFKYSFEKSQTEKFMAQTDFFKAILK